LPERYLLAVLTEVAAEPCRHAAERGQRWTQPSDGGKQAQIGND